MPAELKDSAPLHVVGVEQDGTWFQITTDGHPKKLKTNRDEGGREAGRLKLDGGLVSIKYAERNDKPNPHGGFYHDYYWYSATPVSNGASAASDDGITRVTSTAPAKSPEEAWRIALSVGSDRAVALAPHLPAGEQTFAFVWALAYEFAARIYLTPPPAPGSLEPLAAAVRDDDDDIPF